MATAPMRGVLWVVVTMVVLCVPLCMSADVEVVNASTLGSLGLGSAEEKSRPVKGSPEYLQLFVEETTWYNDLVLGFWLPVSVRDAIPHTLQTWLRNYVAGLILYFVSGGLWCLYVYRWKSDVFFPAGEQQGIRWHDRITNLHFDFVCRWLG